VPQHLGCGGGFEATAEIGVLTLAIANKGAARRRIGAQNRGADELHRERLCSRPLAEELRADRRAAAQRQRIIREAVRREIQHLTRPPPQLANTLCRFPRIDGARTDALEIPRIPCNYR
jgi:hypothetical protein